MFCSVYSFSKGAHPRVGLFQKQPASAQEKRFANKLGKKEKQRKRFKIIAPSFGKFT